MSALSLQLHDNFCLTASDNIFVHYRQRTNFHPNEQVMRCHGLCFVLMMLAVVVMVVVEVVVVVEVLVVVMERGWWCMSFLLCR